MTKKIKKETKNYVWPICAAIFFNLSRNIDQESKDLALWAMKIATEQQPLNDDFETLCKAIVKTFGTNEIKNSIPKNHSIPPNPNVQRDDGLL